MMGRMAVTKEEVETGYKCILIFGCEANGAVDAKSSIANKLFEVLDRVKDENDRIILPDARNIFMSWTPGKDGEIFMKPAKPLLFFGPLPP